MCENRPDGSIAGGTLDHPANPGLDPSPGSAPTFNRRHDSTAPRIYANPEVLDMSTSLGRSENCDAACMTYRSNH